MGPQRGRESFSGNDLPHEKRVTQKRLPTPFARFHVRKIWPGAYMSHVDFEDFAETRWMIFPTPIASLWAWHTLEKDL